MITAPKANRENLIELRGMDDEVVEALTRDDFSVLNEERRAVVEFARQAAVAPHCVGPSHLDDLRDVGYTDADVIQLLAIIGTCSAANMIVSSLNVLPQDRKGDFPAPDADLTPESTRRL